MDGTFYSPLNEERLHQLEAAQACEVVAKSVTRGPSWRVVVMVSLVGTLAIAGSLFGVKILQSRYSVQLDDDEHPPQPGTANTTYVPEKCVSMKVPVPRLEDLTLDEKLGQMTQVDQLAVGSGEDITNFFIGSVLSGGGGAPAWGNGPNDWADIVDNMQAKASKTRLRIPMLYGIDAVHGDNNVDGATIFPHHVGMGATRNPKLMRDIGAAAAREVAATGVRWAFSPTIAVCRDPRWGRCYESFSEVTSVVSNMTTEIDGWQARTYDPADPAYVVPGEFLVAATAKHFVGDGGTFGGKDEGDTQVSEEELRRVHLPPFQEAVRKNVLTVMISYSSWNGVKMHANKYLITDVLKGELGFQGVVVSDWAAIQQIANCNWNCQVRTSINAGLDMIMVPTVYKEFITALKEEVLAGNVSMNRIDDAVRRILRLKVQLGLFADGCAQRSLMSTFGSDSHRELARQAVRESLVLVKNDRRVGGGSMFPLPLDGAKVLVAGSHANDIGRQCGGWTIKWQGDSGNITTGTTVLQGIQTAAKGRAELQYVEQPTGEESADYGIVVVGELPYTEYYGDRQSLQLDASSESAIIAVCGKMPCVVILISGRVMKVSSLVPQMDSFIAAWLPGSEAGKGIADALFSQNFDFSGRLPFTWFADPAQNHVGDSSTNAPAPLFPFGFGLNKKGKPLPIM